MATEILTAATEAQLDSDIDQADLGAPAGTTIEIDLTASFTLTHDLDAVNLAAGEQLVINGGGQALDGAGMHRGVFAYAGTLTIENLALNNMRAQGGGGRFWRRRRRRRLGRRRVRSRCCERDVERHDVPQ
jgi:hypothetical protein